MGLPDEFAKVKAIAKEQRTPQQKLVFSQYLRRVDNQLRGLADAVNRAKAPIPKDKQLVQLQAQLVLAKKPIPEDPRLQLLRRSLEYSTKQLANKRLTIAQDLTWALINSPEFLFNH